MRQQTPQADLVLMPYNYLLDAGSRKPYQVHRTRHGVTCFFVFVCMRRNGLSFFVGGA